MPAVFIAFEGTEGSGKTSQLRRAAEWLSPSVEVVTTREPGGTATAEAVRSLVLAGAAEERDPSTEAFLMNAARRDHCRRLIAPALQRGAVVLSDRFAASTLAYQGAADGVDVEWLHRLEALATDGLQPDRYLLFDLDVEVGLRRRMGAGDVNAIDRRDTSFHRRVRAAYLAMARACPRRWRVIDASRPADTVWDDVRAYLAELVEVGPTEVTP